LPARRLSAVLLLAFAVAAAPAADGRVAGGETAGARASGQPAAQTLRKAIWGPTELNGRSLFPTYRDLGVGIYQIQARWDRIAPNTRPADPTDPDDPAYKWPQHLSDSVAEAARYGMEVQVMIIGTPRWANGNLNWRSPPAEPADFGDFATAISTRYPSVRFWMIWGEPNRKPNFQPVTPGPRNGKGPLNQSQALAPRLYAQLLDSAYGALKLVDPHDRVIGGNTFTASGHESIRPYQWIRYLKLPDGSRPRMDMWGHNPFSFSKPSLKSRPSPGGIVTFSDLRRLARALDRAFTDRPPMKLFLSEWGVPIGFKDRDLLYSVKPAEGVRWIRAAFRITRRWKRIYTLGWVTPVDTNRSSQGLLDRRGRKKASYRAFRRG
jgi:hypothetical protein